MHPARVYVGLHSDRTVVREGEQVDIEAVVVDLEGARKSGTPDRARLRRKDTSERRSRRTGAWVFEYETKESAAGEVRAHAPTPRRVVPRDPDKAGSYTARATAKDDDGHETHSEITLYVHGKDEVVWDQEDRRVDLVADRRKYAPGDIAPRSWCARRSPMRAAWWWSSGRASPAEMPVIVEGGSAKRGDPDHREMVPGATVSAMLIRGRATIAGAPPGQDLGAGGRGGGLGGPRRVHEEKTIVVELDPGAKEIEPKGTIELTIRTHTQDGGPERPRSP